MIGYRLVREKLHQNPHLKLAIDTCK
uniref:Uncharacterized protein n=1 Tax=Rhizophora mucronata TaxID=61149 RepID=A0A2P2PLB1_RHIMU